MKKTLGKIEYNAPVVLTFSLLAAFIFVIDLMVPYNLIENFFVYYGGVRPLDWLRLFLWPFGHASFDHLFGNLSIILLIGPLLEEKYSSRYLAFGMVLTTIVVGAFQALFSSGGILGASGIVFMMIIMTSFTRKPKIDPETEEIEERKNTIPLTFVIIAILYLGREIYNGLFIANNISEMGHILGAIVGVFLIKLYTRLHN